MSKSLARVAAALKAAGLPGEILNPGPSRTADEAALACGCALDQIVKSLIFQGESGAIYLFLTAGGNRLDGARAALVAGVGIGRESGMVGGGLNRRREKSSRSAWPSAAKHPSTPIQTRRRLDASPQVGCHQGTSSP